MIGDRSAFAPPPPPSERRRTPRINSYTAADDPAPGARKPTGVGHSIVASPLGEIVLELGSDPELAIVELDLSLVAAARAALPVLGNSRFSSSLRM